LTSSLQNIIFTALRQVIAKHSILSAIPLSEDLSYPGPYFARLPSIDLRTCVTFLSRKFAPPGEGETDAELDDLLSSQHSRNFKDEVGTKPFWRLTILTTSFPQQFTAVWVVHHALGDGISGLVFHHTFLSALQSTIISEEVDPVMLSPKDALLPPLEDIHPLPLSLGFLMKGQWNEWFPPSLAGLWTGSVVKAPSFTPAKTHIKTVVFSKKQTSELVALSRKNNTTITAVLEVVVASALLANLGPEFGVVQGGGPISLRSDIKSLNVDFDIDQAMGVYVSQYGYTHSRLLSLSPVTPALASFSWDEARIVRQTIVQEVAKKGSDSMVGLLRWVSDLQSFFTKRIGLPRGDSFEVSNVGVFKAGDVEEKEGWNIGRAVFSQCGAIVGVAFGASVVTGGDGCIVMAFSWSDAVVGDGFMRSVIEDVENGVEGLLKGDV
jgi:hypothetical protein